jgi:hypothetical protein
MHANFFCICARPKNRSFELGLRKSEWKFWHDYHQALRQFYTASSNSALGIRAATLEIALESAKEKVPQGWTIYGSWKTREHEAV